MGELCSSIDFCTKAPPNYRVLAISPDLSYLISSGPDERFQLWTLDSRVLIGDFKSQSDSPDSSQAPELFLFSPDGNLIVSFNSLRIRI